MRRRFFIIGVLALTATSAFAQPEKANVRAQVSDFLRKWDAGVAAKNLDGIMGMLAKEYTMVDLDGKVSHKPAVREGFKNMFAGVKTLTSTTRVWNVQLQSQDTVVWSETTMTAVNNSGEKMAIKERYAHTFRWRDGKWQVVQSQTLPTSDPWTFKTNG